MKLVAVILVAFKAVGAPGVGAAVGVGVGDGVTDGLGVGLGGTVGVGVAVGVQSLLASATSARLQRVALPARSRTT